MSRSINRAFLLGNVGNDPEVRTTGSGVKVAKFSLATNRTWNDRHGQKQEKTEWHRCTAWDKIADIVEQYVHKGDRLHVEGSIEYSQSEVDGTTRYFTDIVVRELLMLGNGKDEGAHTSTRPEQKRAAPAPVSAPFDDDDDDLPFNQGR